MTRKMTARTNLIATYALPISAAGTTAGAARDAGALAACRVFKSPMWAGSPAVAPRAACREPGRGLQLGEGRLAEVVTQLQAGIGALPPGRLRLARVGIKT